jgi:hypothetical protein
MDTKLRLHGFYNQHTTIRAADEGAVVCHGFDADSYSIKIGESWRQVYQTECPNLYALLKRLKDIYHHDLSKSSLAPPLEAIEIVVAGHRYIQDIEGPKKEPNPDLYKDVLNFGIF